MPSTALSAVSRDQSAPGTRTRNCIFIIKALSNCSPGGTRCCPQTALAALGRHWGGTQRTETALNDTKPFKIALDYQKQSNIAVRYCSEIALKLL